MRLACVREGRRTRHQARISHTVDDVVRTHSMHRAHACHVETDLDTSSDADSLSERGVHRSVNAARKSARKSACATMLKTAAGGGEIRIERKNTIHMNHLEYLHDGSMRAGETHLASVLIHLPAAAYQHADARAIDRSQPGHIDHEFAHAAADEAMKRMLHGLEQVAQIQATGDLEDRDAGLHAVSFGLGDQHDSDCINMAG